MPNDSRPNDTELQFDRAVPTTADVGSPAALICAACQTTVRTWYYDVEGAPHCAGCKQKAERNSGPIRDWSLTLRASLFGFGAAIVGALIYFGVIAITQFEIGIVALLIGWMVGWALRKGAGGRGGRRLQVIGAGLTYFAVALAYLPMVFKASIDGIPTAAQSSPASGDRTPNEATEPAITDVERTVEPLPFTQDSTADVNPFFALGTLLLFSLGLPLFVVLGSFPSGLISALIIGIGMHQAWSMTRAASITIAGPFKVGRAQSDDAQRGPAATAA